MARGPKRGRQLALINRMNLRVVWRTGMLAGPVASVPEESPAIRGEIEGPKALFTALDGRELALRGCLWRVEVFSVSEISGRHYVQLAVRGESDHMLTLRVMPHAEIRQVILSLLAWLEHPGAVGEIVDVPQ